MKIKTSELTGAALDYAAAMAEGIAEKHITFDHNLTHPLILSGIQAYWPTFIWSQAGPIIEREGIATRRSKGVWYAMLSDDLGDGERAQWTEYTWRNAPSPNRNRQARFRGETQLVAAMRCFVASKLGNEVDVPDELLTPSS